MMTSSWGRGVLGAEKQRIKVKVVVVVVWEDCRDSPNKTQALESTLSISLWLYNSILYHPGQEMKK